MHLLYVSQICYEFALFCANSQSIWRIHYEFHIFFAYSLWINYLFREFTKNSLSFSRIHYKFTSYFATSLSIWRIYQEFTFGFANSLSISRISPDSKTEFQKIEWPMMTHTSISTSFQSFQPSSYVFILLRIFSGPRS